MTDTIEPVKLDDDESKQIARSMVAQARACGVDLVGPDGLLAGLTKQVLELALEEELTDHLGYPPGEREAKTGSNERNGSRSKTVITEIGPVQIDVPRDREGTFEPRSSRSVSGDTPRRGDQDLERALQLPSRSYRRRRPTPGLTPPRRRHQRHDPEHLARSAVAIRRDG